ncbi:NAD-dependent epimerase/dehydratase family protein [Paenibacillus sabinae]|uniref:NAD-dependent epimerase/dehydratase n=1 Tax=Paenibacillus sabinae T27 TaxID=1268072 RepID=X4ZG72_9BACL|nr:NAD-dependent epimerase/dehydratase family protein [Paenibacillus sabinae]AHV96397.1 NAD-dependent epimerase/dehydratase [Paenibacillus sabinae T27]
MKKAIVTGATGFIGSYLVKELINNGYKVLAIIRPNSNNRYRLENLSDVKILECDLSDLKNAGKNINENYDYFFHLGWEGVYGENQSNYIVQLRNTEYALDAMELANKTNCTRFIGAGSIQEKECLVEMQKSQEVTNQGNAYKTAKLASHFYCKLKANKAKIDFFWPLLTNTYGVGETSSRLINSVIQKLINGEEPTLTKGEHLYNFIYITDAVRAYRIIAERGISYNDYIIGSERVIPLKEYLEELKDVVNPNLTLGFGKHIYNGVYMTKQDLYNKNLYTDTGYKTNVPFKVGVKMTADWQRRELTGSKKISLP